MEANTKDVDNSAAVEYERVPLKYRFDTPNRPVAIARYLFNIYKETFLHPTVTSTFDMRTGKVVARDGKELSGNKNGRGTE